MRQPIQLYRGTAANFSDQNPLLLKGELALVYDDNGNVVEMRAGDGARRFNALSPLSFGGGGGGSSFDPSSILAAINLLAPLDNPHFTGTPTGITKAHVGLNLVDNTPDSSKPVSSVQSTFIASAISTAITALIGGAPSQLNALNELAAALGGDANFSATIMALIGTKATVLQPVTLTGSTVLYADTHGNRPLIYNGASGTLTLATDSAATTAGRTPWAVGDAIDVSTLAGSSGVPTISTPDGKTIAGSDTKEINATCKAANAWTVGTLDPTAPGSGGSVAAFNITAVHIPNGAPNTFVATLSRAAYGGVLPAATTFVANVDGSNRTTTGLVLTNSTTLTGTFNGAAALAGGSDTLTFTEGAVRLMSLAGDAALQNFSTSIIDDVVAAFAPSAPTASLGSGNQTTQTINIAAGTIDGTHGTPATYTVEWSSDGGSTYPNSLTPSSSTSQTITGLTAGTAYKARVKANNGTGSSAYSNILSFTTAATAAVLHMTTFTDSGIFALGTTPDGVRSNFPGKRAAGASLRFPLATASSFIFTISTLDNPGGYASAQFDPTDNTTLVDYNAQSTLSVGFDSGGSFYNANTANNTANFPSAVAYSPTAQLRLSKSAVSGGTVTLSADVSTDGGSNWTTIKSLPGVTDQVFYLKMTAAGVGSTPGYTVIQFVSNAGMV